MPFISQIKKKNIGDIDDNQCIELTPVLSTSPDDISESKEDADSESIELTVVESMEEGNGENDDDSFQVVIVKIRDVDSISDKITSADKRERYSLLHLAAKSGDTKRIDQLMAQKVTIDNKSLWDGVTPLHVAIINKQIDAVRCLIGHGADVNALDNDDNTSLHFAASTGSNELAEYILQLSAVNANAVNNDGHTIINVRNNKQRTPLHDAAFSGSVEVVQLLLEHNADVNMNDDNDQIPLHIAAHTGHEKRAYIIQLLDDKAHNTLDDDEYRKFINIASKDELSAIHIDLLDENKKYPNIDVDEMYPFHRACENGDMEIIKYFVEKNDMKNQNDQIEVEAHITIHDINIHISDGKHQEKSLFDARDINGLTPLMRAVSNGQMKSVEYLINKGANIQMRDWNFKTLLHIAVENKRNDIVQLILSGSDDSSKCSLENYTKHTYMINSRDKNYKTPLHYAAINGNDRAIYILLKRIGYTNAGFQGKSPLHCAAECGELECVKVLVTADPDILRNEERWRMNDIDNNSPILLAVKGKVKDYRDVCQYLIEIGGTVECLLAASVTDFIRIIENLSNSNISESTGDEKVKRECFGSVQREIECIKCLNILKGKIQNDHDEWIDATITKLQEEVCQITKYAVNGNENTQKEERDNKVYSMLEKDVRENGGKIMTFLIQHAPIVAKYALDTSIVDASGRNIKKFKFGLLDIIRNDNNEAYFGPEIMRIHNRTSLMTHRVTVKLLKSKWVRFGLGFYILGLAMFLIYLSLLTTLIIFDKNSHGNITGYTNGTIKNEVGNKIENNGINEYNPTMFQKVVPWILFLLCIFQIVTEVLRTYYMKMLVLKDLSTYLELAAYVATIVFMVPFMIEMLQEYTTFSGEYFHFFEHFKWHSGAIAILCAWSTLLCYLKRIPAIGTYVWMFEHVIFSVLRVLISLVCLIIAFAFSFYVLLVYHREFNSIDRSLMKTVIMMFGEFEYDTIFMNEQKETCVITLLIFMVFLIIMPILFMNLLVGLAVGDIAIVRNTAFMRNFVNQVKTLNELTQSYPKWLLTYMYKDEVEDDPDKLTWTERVVEWLIDLEIDDGYREADESKSEEYQKAITLVFGEEGIFDRAENFGIIDV